MDHLGHEAGAVDHFGKRLRRLFDRVLVGPWHVDGQLFAVTDDCRPHVAFLQFDGQAIGLFDSQRKRGNHLLGGHRCFDMERRFQIGREGLQSLQVAGRSSQHGFCLGIDLLGRRIIGSLHGTTWREHQAKQHKNVPQA